MASKGKKISVNEILKSIDITEAEPVDQTICGLRQAMRHIKSVTNELLIFVDDENERKEYFKDVEDKMLTLIRSEVKYLANPKIVDQVMESLPKGPSEEELRDPTVAINLLESSGIIESCNEISTKVKEKLKEFDASLKEKDLKKHPFYLDLLNDIAAINANTQPIDENVGDAVSQGDVNRHYDSDTDVDMDLENPAGSSRGKSAEEMIPVFDPITKQPLTDPVRNSICKHIYGKSSIVSLISRNPRLRCPTIGCMNKEFIRNEHLIQDKSLVGKIKKKQMELKKQKEKEKEKRRAAQDEQEQEQEGEKPISTVDESASQFKDESTEELVVIPPSPPRRSKRSTKKSK